MESDEKVCPRCAETVKAAAAVCKHCGNEFGAPARALTSASPPVEKKKKGRPFAIGCLAILGLMVVVGIIGSHSGSSDSAGNSSSSSSEPAVTPVAVTSELLAAAYRENEVAAQKAYGGQTLDVTGVVSGVTLDFMDNPTLQLVGVNEFLPVQAKFEKSYSDRLSAISKGMRVTVRCTSITEVISAPMLSECSFP